MNTKRKGDYFEKRIVAYLQSCGFVTHKASTVSSFLRGKFIQKGNDLFSCSDILAFRHDSDKVLFIQAKFNPCGVSEAKRKFDTIPTPKCVLKQIWTAREPFIDMNITVHSLLNGEWQKSDNVMVDSKLIIPVKESLCETKICLPQNSYHCEPEYLSQQSINGRLKGLSLSLGSSSIKRKLRICLTKKPLKK